MSDLKSSRMTPQRKLILEELRLARSHPTADEIYARVKLRSPRISLGTVYRNLETLTAQGVIQKLDLCGGQRRFDCNADTHHHVRCIECGAVADALTDPSFAWKDHLKSAGDYAILGVKVEFVGICPKCRMQGEVSVESR